MNCPPRQPGVKFLIKSLFKQNIGVALSIVICVVVGLCAGAFTVNNLSKVQVGELSDYLGSFSNIYINQSIPAGNLLLLSLIQNFKFILFIFILGMTIIGLPGIYVLCIGRSYVTGFSMGVFISAFGTKGVLISFLTILPSDFFKLAAYMILSISAVIFSIRIFKLLARKGYDISFKNSFIELLKAVLVSSGILLIGTLYESLITPVLLRLIL